MQLFSIRRSCIESSQQWYGPDISSRFHVVANGYDADILEPYAKVSPSAAPPLILTHAGNLYGARDPSRCSKAWRSVFTKAASPATASVSILWVRSHRSSTLIRRSLASA